MKREGKEKGEMNIYHSCSEILKLLISVIDYLKIIISLVLKGLSKKSLLKSYVKNSNILWFINSVAFHIIGGEMEA